MKKRTISLLILFAILVTCFAVIPFQAGATSSIRILYKCANGNPTSNTIAPWFKVVNDGPDAINLSQVKIRYWYTRDTGRPQVFNCDYAQVGASNVTGNCVAMSNPGSTADYYLEVGFTAGAGSLASGSNSGEIQARVHNDDWSNYAQGYDYSFNAGMTDYSQVYTVTAYINGVLVFGNEPAAPTGRKFLVIVSKPLKDTSLITQGLNNYMSDLNNAGWAPLQITVDTVSNSNPQYVCASPSALKTVIQSYYNQGYVGFVLIGSSPSIPTAFWRYNQDADSAICPTDLFYADMDAWTDYNSDGVYDSYDSTGETGNFLGANFGPEMIWGRISAGGLTSSINDEAAKVASYLTKIHAYKTTGSNLTWQQWERMLVLFDSDDYKGCRGDIEKFQGLITKMKGLFDDSITNGAKLKTELESGYQFVQYSIHSAPNFHEITEYSGNTKLYSNYFLDFLGTINPKAHYIDMFSCSACSFTDYYSNVAIPNIGANYIFNNDYVLNVSGSTGPWGFMPDATYWKDLTNEVSQRKTIGEAFKNYFRRLALTDGGAPKGVLLGDPTIVYSVRPVTNKMPYITTNLAGDAGQPRVVAVAGQGFKITAADPENDPVTVTVTGLSGGTLTGTNNVTWTPSTSDIGQVFQATVTASDRETNVYTEEFSVKVMGLYGNNLILNNGFETANPLNWSPVYFLSNCTMERDSTVKRGTASVKIYSSGENDCRFVQSVTVAPNTEYQLSGYIQTQGVSGGDRARLSVEYSDQSVTGSIPLSGDNSTWQFVTLCFNSGNHTSLDVQCRLGGYGAMASGTVWFDDLNLQEIR